MDFTIDWAKFGELVVPGVVVGVFMLFAQLGFYPDYTDGFKKPVNF